MYIPRWEWYSRGRNLESSTCLSSCFCYNQKQFSSSTCFASLFYKIIVCKRGAGGYSLEWMTCPSDWLWKMINYSSICSISKVEMKHTWKLLLKEIYFTYLSLVRRADLSQNYEGGKANYWNWHTLLCWTKASFNSLFHGSVLSTLQWILMSSVISELMEFSVRRLSSSVMSNSLRPHGL